MANALNKVNSGGIEDGSIVNADVKSDAAIAGSKLAAATTSAAGSMSAADKTKLDGVATSATANPSAPALTGSTNNTITTVTGANAIQGEANLQFDGSSLGIGVAAGTRLLHAKEGTQNRVVRVESTGTNGAMVVFVDSNTTDDARVRVGCSGGDNVLLRGQVQSFQNGVGTEVAQIDTNGNFKITDGDLLIGTAGHGIDFSANSHASGMSSETLDSYEEGTFTPTAGVDSFTVDIATYTKIGRLVTFQIYGTFGSSSSGTGQYLTSFPFTGLSSTYYSAAVHSNTGSSTGPMGQFGGSEGKLFFKDSSNNSFNGGDMSGHFVNIGGFYYT